VTARWDPGGSFDMLVEMRRIALLIFMRNLFNIDFAPDMDRLWRPILHLLKYISPGLWIFLPGKQRFGYTKDIEAIDNFLYDIIRQRRSGVGVSSDLLSLLVSVPGFDDDLIRDQCLTMLIAGHDTSTALLAWTLYLLGNHPQVMRGVQEEVDQLGGQPPVIEDLDQLPYLEQVIFETLRLYPPIHTGMRFTTDEVELLDCRVPRDSRLMYSIFLTHHMERYWPDAEKFDPQRFCPENKKGRQPYTYMPFGGGPRNCIGAAFAQVEVKVVLARLFQTFEFQWDPAAVHPHMGATLEPRPGVPMLVRRRNS
jgi:cytochrome P450